MLLFPSIIFISTFAGFNYDFSVAAPVIKQEPFSWQDIFQGSRFTSGYPGFNLSQESPDLRVSSRSFDVPYQPSRIGREVEQELKPESGESHHEDSHNDDLSGLS